MDKYDIDIQRFNKVVKRNDIVTQARFKLTPTEQKLICYAISLIKPTDTELNKYSITVSDFCKVCGIDKNHFYSEMQKVLIDIDSKSFWGKFKDKEGVIRWFSEAYYIRSQGRIELKFNSLLKEYLIQLKNNFTSYELINILALDGKYSIQLYELFVSHKFKKEFTIALDELKEYLSCLDYELYKQYRYFNSKILKKSIDEINEKTNINVSYSGNRKGRNIDSINFFVEEKTPIEIYYIQTVAEEKLNKE